MLKKQDRPFKSDGESQPGVHPLLEALLAVHSAPDVPWLTDAVMSASERGVGALYGLLFIGTESGLRGEEPASRERIGSLARITQVLGKDPTRMTIELETAPAVAAALRDDNVVRCDELRTVLPGEPGAEVPEKAQRKLGVSEVWLVPVVGNNEAMGVLILLMPANHNASQQAAELLGRHVAVALSNLREADAARRRGELDAVRWIPDERRFNEELTLEVQRSARHERPLSLLVVRVEGYEEIRRNHGRFLAERVLRRVAATMEDAMRATDFLGAYKDDGFAALLVEADEKAAELARERYMATLAKLDLARANMPGLDIALKSAVATIRPGAATAEQLLSAAEQRLAEQSAAEKKAA